MLLSEFKEYVLYEKTNIIINGEGGSGRRIEKLPQDFSELAEKYGGGY